MEETGTVSFGFFHRFIEICDADFRSGKILRKPMVEF